MTLSIRRLALAGALAGLMAACDSSTNPDMPSVIIVVPESLAVDIGFGAQVVATVNNMSGQAVLNAAVTFASADTTIALVTGSGLVIGVSGGRTNVYASIGALIATVPVLVRPARFARTVTVAPPSATIPLLGSVQLTATVRDSSNLVIAGAATTWSSSDTTIATVSAAGLVTAKKVGSATVHVASGPAGADVAITVSSAGPVTSITRVAVGARPFGAAISSLGEIYVTQQDSNQLTRINLGTLTVDGKVAVGLDPGDVTFLTSGLKAFVTNFNAGTVGLVDVNAGAQTSTVSLGAGNPNAFRILRSHSGGLLYVTDGNGALHIFDTTLTAAASAFTVAATPNGLASKGDTLLYVSSSGSGTITEVSLLSHSILRTLTVGGTPQDIALSADGSELYIADETGLVRVMSLPSGSIVASITENGGPFGLGLSSDGYLYVSLQAAGKIAVINAASRTEVAMLTVGGKPRRIAFDPNSKAVAVPNEGGWVDVIH